MSFAQCAGWIDGEGHIGIGKSYVERIQKFEYKLTLLISNSKIEMLNTAQKILSCGILRHRKLENDWSDSYTLEVSGYDVIYVLKKVLPYLVTKLEQAKIAIEKDPERLERATRDLRSHPTIFQLNQTVMLKSAKKRIHSNTTGREVSPHNRRGHYRMQPHGKGLSLKKRIWIAPLKINWHKFLGLDKDTSVLIKDEK